MHGFCHVVNQIFSNKKRRFFCPDKGVWVGLAWGVGVYRVAPVAYQVILEPGTGQFREFEPPRVHTRINSWGLFSCAQIDLRTARERELATLDE